MTVLDQLYKLQQYDIDNNLNIITEDDVNALIKHSQMYWRSAMSIEKSTNYIIFWFDRNRSKTHISRDFEIAEHHVRTVISMRKSS